MMSSFSVQYMVECVRLEVLAEASVIRLLTRRVFRGWSRLTREGRVEGVGDGPAGTENAREVNYVVSYM